MLAAASAISSHCFLLLSGEQKRSRKAEKPGENRPWWKALRKGGDAPEWALIKGPINCRWLLETEWAPWEQDLTREMAEMEHPLAQPAPAWKAGCLRVCGVPQGLGGAAGFVGCCRVLQGLWGAAGLAGCRKVWGVPPGHASCQAMGAACSAGAAELPARSGRAPGPILPAAAQHQLRSTPVKGAKQAPGSSLPGDSRPDPVPHASTETHPMGCFAGIAWEGFSFATRGQEAPGARVQVRPHRVHPVALSHGRVACVTDPPFPHPAVLQHWAPSLFPAILV